MPSYLGLGRDADAAEDGCGLFEPDDLRFLDEEPDACADEEGCDAGRSGSDRMSRTSLEVILANLYVLKRSMKASERRELASGLEGCSCP